MPNQPENLDPVNSQDTMPNELAGNVEPVKRGRGRPRGSRNWRSQIARDLCEKRKVDPLDYALSVIKNRRNTTEIRLQAAQMCIGFVHPRLTTSQVLARIDHDVSINHKIRDLCASDPAIAHALEALALKLAEPEPAVIDVTAQRLELPAPTPEEEL
jgi:hypothetical protein